MADIRSSPELDDFSRVEDPMSFGGRWRIGDYAMSGDLKTTGSACVLNSGISTRAVRYWRLSPSWDGDWEVWARAGGIFDDGAAADLYCVTDVEGTDQIDGYRIRVINTFGGSGARIERITNYVATVISVTGPYVGNRYYLLRRRGSLIEAYTAPISDINNWVLIDSVTDTTYMTNMRPGLGHSVAVANSPSWVHIGGGIKNHQQIYRVIRA